MYHRKTRWFFKSPDKAMIPETSTTEKEKNVSRHKPRLAFLGTGWIGKNRMESLHNKGLAEISGIATRFRRIWKPPWQ